MQHTIRLAIAPGVAEVRTDNGLPVGALISPLVQADICIAAWVVELLGLLGLMFLWASPFNWARDLRLIWWAATDWRGWWKMIAPADRLPGLEVF